MTVFANRIAATLLFAVSWWTFDEARLDWSSASHTVARVLMVAGFVWAGQYLWRQKTTKPLLTLVSVVAAIVLGMSFYYLRAEHVIFSAIRDDFVFRAYCKGRPPLVFATYVEIRSRGGTPISLFEIPPSSDDLADCKARFPIVDMRPDPTYSCLRISFENNTRSPLLMPLPLVDGLDLPLKVRNKMNGRRNWRCETDNVEATQ